MQTHSSSVKTCRHCMGKKTVSLLVKGKTETRTCPACDGTGNATLRTK